MSSRSNVAVGPVRITPLSLCLREQISPQAMVCTAGVYTADVKVRSWHRWTSAHCTVMCNVSVASVSGCFSPDVPYRLPPQGLPEKLPPALWLLFFLAEQFVHICPIVFIPCQFFVNFLSYLVMRQMCLLRNMCVSCASIFVVFVRFLLRSWRSCARHAPKCPRLSGILRPRDQKIRMTDVVWYLICWIFV